MLMSYVTASGLHGHGMDELSELHLNHKPIAYKDVVGTGRNAKNFSEITPEDARDYASEDADVTLRLHHVLKPQLRTQKATRVYELIERPLIDVIVAMEAEGIKVSPEKLKAMSEEFAQKMEGFEAEIYQLAGREFTIGSPKQLGEILFDELGIEGGKKSSKPWRRKATPSRRRCWTGASFPS
jgi:DNA polymerase-1